MNLPEVLSNRGWLVQQYVTLGLSMQNIADKIGTNKQRVRRALKKQQIPIKTKSEAQKTALEKGRATHPTEGTKRTQEVKEKIAESVSKSWDNASEEMLEHRSNMGRQQWDKMTMEQKEALLKMARDAVRETSKTGSKLEKYLREALTNAGYDVKYHVQGVIPNIKLEIDILLPGMYTVIEVDGPSHFLPIWGDENLQKNIASDLQKTGLLLHQGLVVIRIKQMSDNLSPFKMRGITAKLLEKLLEIEKEFPGKNDRLIEIEV